MTTPANEWSEYVQHAYDSILFNHNPIEADKQFGEMLESVLNNLLTQHFAHLVERNKSLRAVIKTMDKELQDGYEIMLYDIYAMAFYRDTGIWPPGKSAPMEMHHEFDQAERSEKYREWLQALDQVIDIIKDNK